MPPQLIYSHRLEYLLQCERAVKMPRFAVNSWLTHCRARAERFLPCAQTTARVLVTVDTAPSAGKRQLRFGSCVARERSPRLPGTRHRRAPNRDRERM